MTVLAVGGQPGWAEVTYSLMAPLHMTRGFRDGSRAEKIERRISGTDRR